MEIKELKPMDKSTISGAVVIPDKIDDYPVVGIDMLAFNSCWDLTEITIPKTVNEIGNYAFPDHITINGYKGTIAETYAINNSITFNAIGEVVPEFNNDPVTEAYKMADGRGDSILVYPAKMNNDIVGYAMNSSANGFAGDIQIIVGFDMEDKIVNYAILQHAETPGLGSKMDVWFKDITKPSQSIIGKDLSQGLLIVTNDGGTIDAITASTITSRAFLDAVNRAYAAYTESILDINSGATDSANDDSQTKVNDLTEEGSNDEK